MKQFFIKKNKGFTLVETLVAISILSLSILATFTAVQGGLKVSSTSREQIVAFYLTQEVLEYIKNIRDQNVLNSLSTGTTINWLTGVANTGDACASNQICEIDSPAKTVTVCSGGANNCRFLKYDSSTGLLGYSTGTNTIYKRSIQVQSISSEEARVTVTITWTGNLGNRTFQVTESLFNRR